MTAVASAPRADATGRLAGHLAAVAAVPADPAARQRLPELLVDGLGVAVAGRAEPVSRAFATMLAEPRAPWDRAWLHGVEMHALDFDDTHEPSLCHSATALLPALIALARARRLSGARLLDAYDLGLRVVDVLTPLGANANETGSHSTAIVGALASAAACSWLLDGDAAQAARAMEFAALAAAGLGVAFGTDAKPVQGGRAAEVGVRSALFAAQGVGAPHGAVLGDRGLVARFLGIDAVDALRWDESAATAAQRVALKPYPSCFLTHSTIDAMLSARDALGLGAESEVAAIRLTLHPTAAAIADKTDLRTIADAKFSLRYCALLALREGAPTVPGFEEATVRRITVSPEAWTAWVDRFRVEVNASLPRIGAQLVLDSPDGRSHTEFVPTPRGSVGHPLGAADVAAKFGSNVAGAVAPDGMAATLEALRSIAQADDVAAVAPLTALLPPG